MAPHVSPSVRAINPLYTNPKPFAMLFRTLHMTRSWKRERCCLHSLKAVMLLAPHLGMGETEV